MDPAFELLARRPLTPAAAVSKLRRGVQDNIAGFLEHTGQIRRVRLQSKRFHHPYAWPVINRERVDAGPCGAVVGAVRPASRRRRRRRRSSRCCTPWTGSGALLSLNDRGWRWVHMRAGEIASGSWVDEYETALPEMNLAVTASAMRPALT